MAVDETRRHQLYIALEELIGADNADILMSMLPPHEWTDIATGSDLALLRSELDQVRADVERVKSDVELVKSDVELVKSDVERVKSDVELVKADVAELKADMGLVRIELDHFRRDIRELESRVELRFDAMGHKFDSSLESKLRHQTRVFFLGLTGVVASLSGAMIGVAAML